MNILSGIVESVQLLFRRPRRQQFAALCYRMPNGAVTPEILVLTSRDTGRWVIPKGWPMEGKAGYEVSQIEAMEEAGITGEIEHDPLGFFHYDKGYSDGFSIPCQVQVHALRVTGQLDEFKEKGKRKIEWVSYDVAAKRVREPQLKQMILSFATRFRASAA